MSTACPYSDTNVNNEDKVYLQDISNAESHRMDQGWYLIKGRVECKVNFDVTRLCRLER